MKSLACKIVTSVALLAAVAGFSQTQSDTFKVAGVSRTYYMHVPTSGLSKPPLVFMLHGHGGNGVSEESGDKWFPIADREKFIAVYPNAISGNWDQSDSSKDLPFVLAILDSIDAKYHIDRNRVYVAGFSQGAAMSQTFGCKYSDVFAAMAAGSGGLSGTCKLKRPLPVFVTFGGSSDMFASAAWSSVPLWLSYDSLPTTPKVTRPYPPTNPKSVVTRLTYGPGKNGVLIVVDSIHNDGHEWAMDTVTKVNNSEEAWAFFKQYSLNTTTVINRQSIAMSRDCFSATYRAGIVCLQGVAEKDRVQVVDTRGRLIAAGIAKQGQFTLKDKPSGIYMVMVNRNNMPVAIRMVIP
jgi:polyhydroxybutyrate depolymerase